MLTQPTTSTYLCCGAFFLKDRALTAGSWGFRFTQYVCLRDDIAVQSLRCIRRLGPQQRHEQGYALKDVEGLPYAQESFRQSTGTAHIAVYEGRNVYIRRGACMYVRMRLCMYVRMYVCMYVCMSACMYEGVYVCMRM